MLQQQGQLEKRVQDNVTQVWSNQEELKGGMDAAEFNLRAHQKVLNALAIELERLVQHLNDEVFSTEHKVEVLELADVKLPAEDGQEAQVVRRLNWPYYHEQVEHDLKILAELEAQRLKEEAEKKAALEMEASMKKMTEASEELVKAAEEAGNDPEEVRQEYHKLMDLTQRVSVALGKKLRGEEYDIEALTEAQALIDRVDALDEDGDDMSEPPPPEQQEEEAAAPPPQDEDIPEGASVFGG